jgi:hypothetical protein
MKAGAMLRALVSDGLVQSDRRFTLDDSAPLLHYWLSSKGEDELREAEARAEKYGRPGPRRRTA